jgi:outer membrane murein-binding lipoprotein Lpp
MDAQRRSEITEWDARQFSGGFAELGRLVDRGFSGAVTDGTAWLFVYEGRVVGAVDGDLDDFAEAAGTLYEAPEAVLPVLFAMQERGGEPRAQYYTNETPLSEADRKLSQGGFTGYVELSENVLSGDYYVTYTAGESMAAAYIGNARRLETGEEAFSLADDEVGIYSVYEVDLDVREIPGGGEADSSEGTGPVAASDEEESEEEKSDGEAVDDHSDSDGAGNDVPTGEESDGDEETRVSGVARQDPTDGSPNGDAPSVDDPVGDDHPSPVEIDAAGDESDGGDRRASGESSSEGVASADEATSDADDAGDITGTRPVDAPGDRRGDHGDDGVDRDRADDADATRSDDDADATRSDDDDVFSEEEQWREQKSIPALDPSEASDPAESRDDGGAASTGDSQRSQSQAGASRRDDAERAGGAADDASPQPRSTGDAGTSRSAVSQRSRESDGQRGEGAPRERLRRLESALEESERERESLADELEEAAAERDDIESQRDELAAEVDRLESEVSTLREERDRLRDELAAARDRLPEGDRSLSSAEARSGTNLFVRYDSKGGATLEDAHDGAVDRDMLRENLRIEHHTSFETDGLTVDGQPFEEFLQDTIEYGFTRWLVEDLPFEVSGTGNQGVLRDLYDAIPEIDRAEIGGSVSIAIRENGEETREQRAFDLVLRDRMGNPLFVADLNDSRDPTQEGTLESLVGNGRDIAESNESFAAAFAVTESFFEPGALETASDAVGGGLFSRSKRASFVKLSRKRGYHLCLVEARDGGFHMTVPDL